MYTNKTSRRPDMGRQSKTYSVLSELSRSLFDDAMVICDDEREAAFVASARLLCLLEKKRAVGGKRKAPAGSPGP